MSNTFMRDEGKRDFVNAIQRANSTKLGPNHYTIFDAGGFVRESKKVKFAYNKEQRTSVIDQMAKKRAWVPGANHYSPERKDKTIGNYL